MGYQKFRADRLFDGYAMRETGQVLITTSDGTVEAIVPFEQAGGDILELEGILTPGFINCHCHLELSHMKGLIEEGRGLIEFVSRVMQDRHQPEESILEAIKKAEEEMLREGIVAVGDICNNKLTLAQKSAGNILYYNFIEASGVDPAVAGPRFERALDIYRSYAGLYSEPEKYNAIVPHAPYSVSPELWKKIAALDRGRVMTMHNQEMPGENEFFRAGTGSLVGFYEHFNLDISGFSPTGQSSLRSSLSRFGQPGSLILVHNVHTSADDIDFAQQERGDSMIHWCLCPNANLYIGGRLPDIGLFLERQVPIVLGTDSLASNHSLSILAEIRRLQEFFPFLRSEILLKWATINGARALQLDGRLGSFETGKKPGVVLCDESFSGARRLV